MNHFPKLSKSIVKKSQVKNFEKLGFIFEGIYGFVEDGERYARWRFDYPGQMGVHTAVDYNTSWEVDVPTIIMRIWQNGVGHGADGVYHEIHRVLKFPNPKYAQG